VKAGAGDGPDTHGALTDQELSSVVREPERVGVSDPAYVAVSADSSRRAATVYRVRGAPLPEDVRRDYETAAQRYLGVRYSAAMLSTNQRRSVYRAVRREQEALRISGTILTAIGNEPYLDQPFVIGFRSEPPPPDVVERLQRYGRGCVVLREGGASASRPPELGGGR
jgi:hypothetical protein